MHSIVYKGMDYHLKLELLSIIQYLDILESFTMKYRERNENDDYEE